jgi:hypothetical protein
MVPSARRVPGDRRGTIVILAHIAGIPVDEWSMPLIISAGAALVGIGAVFGSSQSATLRKEAWRTL